MKLAIVGPGRAGKDEAARWLSARTRLHYALSTSEVIAPEIARRKGIAVTEAFANRHRDRDEWRRVGDEMRARDPAALARKTLAAGDICVGIRARVEIEAVIRERLVDLVVWVDRDVPEDPTLEYGAEMVDVVILNHWGVEELHGRLERLARTWGVLNPA